MIREDAPSSPADPVRINKYLAACGVASRRGADELIARGEVRLNGAVVTSPGVKIRPGVDRLEVSGREVRPAAGPELTLLLHKPVEVVTTLRDPQGRRTVLDLLPPEVQARRPAPVGRLDYFSEGLLLLTTDGDPCHRLTHPSRHVD
ncbi:MAG: pseudouridine synthase, partial [Desulfovibrionaceae bacterium]